MQGWRPVLILLTVAAAFGDERDPAGDGFPKPDPVNVYSELKILSAAHSVWRRPLEDWSGARRRLTSDPAWSKWFSGEQAEVDQWMAHRQDYSEWIAGWWHDFVSPKDGSFLTWTPAVPGKEATFLSSPSDPRVEITPKIFEAWVGVFRGRHVSMVQRAARLWRLTGDPRYAKWATEQLDFYANNLGKWPVQNRFYGPSRLGTQPLDDAGYLAKLVDAARLTWDWAEPERRRMWFESLFLPEAEMLNASMHRIHNIACWLRSASAQVALLYGDEGLWRFAVDGPWGVRQQLAHGVTSDFFWYEQSMGYNEFVAQALIPFFVEAALQGRGQELEREMAIVEDMILAPTWLRFPNGYLPNPADNTVSFTRYAPLTGTLLRAYRVLPTPQGLAEARKVQTWESLIDPPPAMPVDTAPLPAVVSHDFSSSRFAILSAGGWQVFFHYGQLTGSHAQAEALNFEAFFGETDITHEPCTVGYSSPLHREYFTLGFSHNVPLVNGEGEQPPQPGELVAFDEENATVAAAQSAYRVDTSAARTLRIVGSRLIDEATIFVLAGNPQVLGLALHVQGKVELPPNFQPVADFAAGRPKPFGYWREVRSAAYHESAAFDIVYPNGLILRVTFSLPGEFRVFHGSAPDSPVPARRDAFYLETRRASVTFTTEFCPLTAPAKP
jgi:hypothetical protein